MNIFYTTGLVDDILLLDEQESHHCIKVLRTREGDLVRAVDGVGGYYEANLLDANHKQCKLKIVKSIQNFHKATYELHIAIAPTKNIDRFEWFLEKATEIGVTSITPIICERSERRTLRLDRLEKVIISAMKQSVKAYKPLLNQPVTFENWCKEKPAGANLIAHCMEGSKINLWQMSLPDSIRIAIGPEGDFTSGELGMAVKLNFNEISLGNYRLRTETAGIVACSAVYFTSNK